MTERGVVEATEPGVLLRATARVGALLDLLKAALKWHDVHDRWRTHAIDKPERLPKGMSSTRADVIETEKRLFDAVARYKALR